MISYRYLPAAREDLNKAAAFYEASVPGLREAFLDDVERAIEDLRENPRIGAPVTRAFRRRCSADFHPPLCTRNAAMSLSLWRLLIIADAQDTGADDNDAAQLSVRHLVHSGVKWPLP